jgi:hypothetical protein
MSTVYEGPLDENGRPVFLAVEPVEPVKPVEPVTAIKAEEIPEPVKQTEKEIYKGTLDENGWPVKTPVKQEFGPFRERYKGIDKEVSALMSRPIIEAAEELVDENNDTGYMTVYRGNMPRRIKRSEYLETTKQGVVDLKNFGVDLQKMPIKVTRGVVDLAASGFLKSFADMDMGNFSPKEREDFVNDLTEKALDTTPAAFVLGDWKNNPNIVNQDTGRMQYATTKGAMVLEMGALAFSINKAAAASELVFLGSRFIPKIAPMSANWSRTTAVATQNAGKYITTVPVKNQKLLKGLSFIAGAEIATQVYFDPDDSIANALQEAIPPDASGKLGMLRDVSLFLSSDVTDSELEKRLKLSVESLVLSGIFTGLIKSPAIARYMVGKDPSQMTKLEQETVLLKALEDEKQIRMMQDPSQLTLIKETPEGLAQVERQRDSFLSRMNQKWFKSRGYSTPLMFHASNNAKFTQKALVNDAQFVAEQLDRAIISAIDDPNISKKVFNLLETDVNAILKLDVDQQASAMSKKYKVPEDVAEQVLEFRRLQDGLSKRILNMDGFSDEAKEVITENLGKYVRRTYRAYEDAGYKPTKAVKKNAIKYFVDKIQAQAAVDGIVISPKQALKQAEGEVKKLLKNDDEMIDYVAQINRVASLKKKKDIDPEIRELLGEITNPSEKIVLSLAKLTRISEMQQYYNVINQLSKGAKGYVQGKENVARGLTVQIKGTNSILDSKWTTPEIERAILNKESSYKTLTESDTLLADGWRFYVGAKGLSQSMQTVYNVSTQARNAIGGASFLVANGHAGLGLKGSLKSASVLEDKIFGVRSGVGRKTGLYKVNEKALSAYYSEMQSLGVVGTSVNVNQFREMISTGFKGSTSIARDIGAGQSRTVKGAKTIFTKPRDIYSGTDDFAKIISFENEIDTLRLAFPDASESLLKQRAASIVKNTLPNYEAIPMGIKQLRNLPLGNFISFPAEVMRTSYHIVKQASKEINSTNSVIKRRGQARLLGFVTANVGYGMLAEMSHKTFNMSDQEVEDRRILKSGEYSSGHDLIYSQDENGDYYTTNTEYLNSYYYLKEPALAFYDRIRNGNLRGEELDSMLLGAVGSGIKALTDPFTAESMVLEPWVRMAAASLSKDGADFDGVLLFPDKASGVDNFSTVITEALKPLIPGTVKNAMKLSDAIQEKPDKWEGRFRNIEYAKMEQFGIKKDLYRADDYLKWAARDYRLQNKQNRADGVNLETTSQDMIVDYFKTNAVEYEYQQNLWVKGSAYSRLFSRRAALDLLVEVGIPIDRADKILRGEFTPLLYSTDPTRHRRAALLTQSGEDQSKMNRQMNEAEVLQFRAFKEMQGLSLSNPEGYSFKPSEGSRALDLDPEFDDSFLLPKATGGEISEPVANAPTEPDERINKLTGLPYNEEAGAAYMDADDPLRAMNMAAGGLATKLKKIYKKIPTSVRLFVEFIAEKEGPITNEDFTPEELDNILEHVKNQDLENIKNETELRKALVSAKETYKEWEDTDIKPERKETILNRITSNIKGVEKDLKTYADTDDKLSVNSYDFYDDSGVLKTAELLSNSSGYNIQTSLGMFTAYKNDDDTITIRDKYNWPYTGDEKTVAVSSFVENIGNVSNPRQFGNLLANTFFKNKPERKVEFTLPYNENAKTSYTDTDNTDEAIPVLDMAAGGRVKKGAGSLFVKKAIEKVVAPALKKTMKPTEAVEEVVETAAQRKARRRAENSDSSKTQIGGTENTAKKAIAYLEEQGATGLTLDYGAGFGKNAKAINADATFEPFPKEGFKPTYIDLELIPEGKFDRVISTNVLNVLPRDIRDEAVVTIGKTLKNEGQAVIQAWSPSANKYRLKQKNFTTAEEANSSRSLDGGKFQKGFSKDELRDYVQETLGDGFEVSTVPNKRGISMSSVLIKKLAKGEKRLQKNCGGKVLDTLRRNNR